MLVAEPHIAFYNDRRVIQDDYDSINQSDPFHARVVTKVVTWTLITYKNTIQT